MADPLTPDQVPSVIARLALMQRGATTGGLWVVGQADAAALALAQQALRLLDDLRAEYADEHARGKAACDKCEDCGPMVMCRFHSAISLLFGDTWTTAAIDRDNQRRRLLEDTDAE